MNTTRMGDSDLLADVLDYSDVLTELRGEPLSREEIAKCLDVSSSTSYRYANRLEEMDLVAESGEEIHLTPLGETIASELATFETAVQQSLRPGGDTQEKLLDLLRHSPGLQALSRRPLDRRELEDRLGVSDSTGYRITRSLEEAALIEKENGRYTITPTGREVLEAVSEFEANVRTAVRLGPVMEVIRETTPEVPLDAFADATVTDVHGYTYNPQIRYLELLEETETFRGIGTESIVPSFFVDIREHVMDGMEMEILWTPETVAKHLAKWPEHVIDVCHKDNVSVYLHDAVRFDLAMFDNRIGIGTPDAETGVCRVFVDTDSPAARTWAETVYESYKAEAVFLQRFEPTSLQRAVEKMRGGEAPHVEQR